MIRRVPELFTLRWLTGSRVRMCYGCASPICTDTSTVPSPPYDMVIRYKERISYRDPKTNTEGDTADKKKTFYHPLKRCVLLKHSDCLLWMLYVPTDLVECLTPVHKHH